MPSRTRRGFMTGFGSLAAASLTAGSVDAQSQGQEAQYGIGLPIEQQWSFGFAGDRGVSPIVNPGTITDDIMYVSLESTDLDPAKVFAVDRDTHDRIWEATADPGVSPPVVADDTLFLTLGSVVHAYPANEAPAEALWKDEMPFDDALWPLLVDENVCIAGYDIEEVENDQGSEYHYRSGGLALYQSDGSRKWFQSGESMNSPYLYNESLIHVEGHQYQSNGSFFAQSGRLVSRDSDTGKVQWRTPDFNVYSMRMAWSEDLALAYSQQEAIRAIDPTSGKVQWTLEIPNHVGDYAIGPDHIYIVSNPTLEAISYPAGETVWMKTDIDPYDVFYRGGLVFVGTRNAEFYAFDAETGNTVWKSSLPNGNGFFRYIDGVLYTFAANWVGAHIGKRGVTLQRLKDAQSTDGLGMLTASVANFLGRDRALERAETAFEDNQYEAANRAIAAAERRETAVTGAALLVTGSFAYGGGRVSMHNFRYRSLETALADVESSYPIESGALEGLSPKSLITQGNVAVESLDGTTWGRPLRHTLSGTDEYGELTRDLQEFASLQDDLETVSLGLSKHRQHIDSTAWRSTFNDVFDDNADELTETLQRCQQALKITGKHVSIKKSSDTNSFDLKAISALLERIKSPESPSDSTAIDYCDTVLTTINAYTDAKTTLSGYDLSNVQSVIQSTIQTNADHRRAAIGSLEDTQDLLNKAGETESSRQTLDLNHSDITHEEIKEWLQAALSETSIESIKKVENAVSNLEAGIWGPEHLYEYSPTQFEHLVADLYDALGYRTKVTQQSNDAGIDVMAQGESEKIAIQVKQYSPGNNVGRPAVQQTAGVRSQVGATKAVIVTSSDFTQTAEEASRQYGESIELINGTELTRRLSHSSLTPPTGVGSKRSKQRHRGHRSQRSKSAGQNHKTSGEAAYTGGGAFCMVCGDHFRSSLEEIQTPDGETIRCCPRCKQLIEQTTNFEDHDRKDALKILGLSSGASPDEIKQAYRERVSDVHPDQGGSYEEFQRVQNAYETLLN